MNVKKFKKLIHSVEKQLGLVKKNISTTSNDGGEIDVVVMKSEDSNKNLAKKLKLTKRGIDDDVASRIASCLDALAGEGGETENRMITLESANFSGNKISHVGLEMLLKSFKFKIALNLSGNPIGDPGMKILCRDTLPVELNLRTAPLAMLGFKFL